MPCPETKTHSLASSILLNSPGLQNCVATSGQPQGNGPLLAPHPSLKSLRCCQGAFAQSGLLWGRFLEKNKDYKGYCLALMGNWMPDGRGKSHFRSSHFLWGKEHSLFCFVAKKRQNWQNDLGNCDFPVCLSHHILAGPSRVSLSNTLYCCIWNAIHLWELKSNPIKLTQLLTIT